MNWGPPIDGQGAHFSAHAEARTMESKTESPEAIIASLRAELAEVRGRARKAAQRIIEEIGAPGPEGVDETAERAAQRLAALNAEVELSRKLVDSAEGNCRAVSDEINALRAQVERLRDFDPTALAHGRWSLHLRGPDDTPGCRSFTALDLVLFAKEVISAALAEREDEEPNDEQEWTFAVDDRVQRHSDVYDPDSPVWHGKVVDRYQRLGTRHGDYPELYDVRWNHVGIRCAYLPHGIQPDETSEGDGGEEDDP